MKKILIILIAAIGLSSCEKEDKLTSNLFIEEAEKNELDNYLDKSFTVPYNLLIDYKWPSNEVNYEKILLPVNINAVKPFCEQLKQLWINPYLEHVDEVFLKKYLPKQLVLIGSYNYNADGTITEGVAANGRRITIYGLNHYEATDRVTVQKQFLILHHEFYHILNQNKNYDPYYKTITVDTYTSTWYQLKLGDALSKGYISTYSMESPDEDFVEVAAHLVMLNQNEWQTLMSYATPEGRAKIEEKVGIVKDYFIQEWGIDLISLRDYVQTELAK